MKKRILLFLSLIFSISVVATAQTKTVTNSDLEKFRQTRLAAEKDYRENYAKLGFPSPEALEKQIAENERRMRELSAQLRAERLVRERTDALQAQINALAAQNEYLQSNDNRPSNRNYYYGTSPYIYLPYGNYGYSRSNYNRRNRAWRNNSLPPIRPPKPIRVPRFLQTTPRFRNRRR